MFLSDVSIKRPVFATMMMVALVVLGVVSYDRLAIDEYPDVTYPVVSVSITYPGASPEVMAQQVSRPIEQAVNTVAGLSTRCRCFVCGISGRKISSASVCAHHATCPAADSSLNPKVGMPAR